MAKKTYDWENWGRRFMHALKTKGGSLRQLAGRSDALAKEAGIRHWTNGTRPITLYQFFKLCDQAGLDPHDVLFGGRLALTKDETKVVVEHVVHALEEVRALPAPKKALPAPKQ